MAADAVLVQEPDGASHVLVRETGRRLPGRERRILYWRFFEDMTHSAIAAELGLSQMHVSRLISRALARVRAEVEHNAEQEYGAAA